MSLATSREEALLEARHFKGGATRLDESGLHFD